MVNWDEADFTDILVSGSNTCTGVLKAEGEKHGLTIATFNPLSCFNESEDLADIKSSAGLSIWRDDDPVHLSINPQANTPLTAIPLKSKDQKVRAKTNCKYKDRKVKGQGKDSICIYIKKDRKVKSKERMINMNKNKIKSEE